MLEFLFGSSKNINKSSHSEKFHFIANGSLPKNTKARTKFLDDPNAPLIPLQISPSLKHTHMLRHGQIHVLKSRHFNPHPIPNGPINAQSPQRSNLRRRSSKRQTRISNLLPSLRVSPFKRPTRKFSSYDSASKRTHHLRLRGARNYGNWGGNSCKIVHV